MSCLTARARRPCKASDNWTCITFNPDLAKFDMELLEPDTVALMAKRVYDTAGVLGKGCKARQTAGRGPSSRRRSPFWASAALFLLSSFSHLSRHTPMPTPKHVHADCPSRST